MRTRHEPTSRTGSRGGVFRRTRGERGAVLVHVAISMIALIAFNGLVIDYGILWLARRQAQNSADAAAMAGAVSLGFVDINDHALARQSAMTVADQNYIWGVTPDIEDTDVTFPPCPPGSPGAGTNACIRVDVFRNQRTSAAPKPIPTIFGTLFGVTEQGVKATATAEVLYGTSVNCVRPWAIPDKWEEYKNDVTSPPPAKVGWDPADSFERYDSSGNLLPGTPDFYQPWGDYSTLPPSPYWKPELFPDGTGYTNHSVTQGGDYGLKFVLKPGNPHNAIAPGWFYPVVTQSCCVGGDCYRDSISGCVCPNDFLAPPAMIQNEPGNMIGPTKQGVDALVAQDPGAYWDPDANDGKGGIGGGCMATNPPSCTTTNGMSPRLVPIPVFDPDVYDKGKASGRQDIQITKLVGFFVLPMNGKDVEGYLMDYPTVPVAGPPAPPGATFLISIALVR
jgi:hypothetical protein